MQWTDKIRRVKIVFVLAAILIAVGSLVVSKTLTDNLKREERGRMEVWAEAMKSMGKADENTDLSLVLKVLNENDYIPVVLLDRCGNVTDYRNVSLHADNGIDSLREARQLALGWLAKGHAIKVAIDDASHNYINVCYDESLILKRLTIFRLYSLPWCSFLSPWRCSPCLPQSGRNRTECGQACRRRLPISLARPSVRSWRGWRC